jgi:branched-chain amino acid transport system substrate-binding protein
MTFARKLNLKAVAIAISSAFALAQGGNASAQISGDTIKIGLITDLSGVYADIHGPGSIEAIKLAIADFGGAINGKKIELLVADHLNKTDVAASKAREWFDQQGVDLIIGGTNSSTQLAMAKIAAEKKKPFVSIGGTSPRLTNEECTPYTVAYTYDTVALARGTGAAIVKQGGKSWYFLSADYVFGAGLEKDTSEVVKSNGGTVVGSIKFPLSASDFSSFLLQAQSSKAQILGLASGGGDTINAIKGASEFGINKTMKLAGLLIFETDIHSLGLDITQGMYLTSAWYWDMNEETREWTKRYREKTKKFPGNLHAADYSAVSHYLKAVKAIGTDDSDKVLEKMRATKINDVYAKGGVIRPDGRMVHDLYLMQIKTPKESKYPWDYYKVIETIPGQQAFINKAESKCALWK